MSSGNSIDEYVNTQYSTTRCLTSIQPIIKNKSPKAGSQLLLGPNPARISEGGLRTRNLFKNSRQNEPLISVITVVYNGGKYLEQAILSVLTQSYNNVEFIIVDGGSTDKSVSIIEKYQNQIDYWVSEEDGGIYEAMNKGLTLAIGEIISFLNSDDWYDADSLNFVANNISGSYLACGIRKLYSNGRSSAKVLTPHNLDGKDLRKLKGMPFPHPGLFVKSSVFESIGGFSLQYKIAADMEFVYRMLNSGYKGTISEHIVANFRSGGESTKLSVLLESRCIEYIYGASLFGTIFTLIWRFIKVALSRTYGKY